MRRRSRRRRRALAECFSVACCIHRLRSNLTAAVIAGHKMRVLRVDDLWASSACLGGQKDLRLPRKSTIRSEPPSGAFEVGRKILPTIPGLQLEGCVVAALLALLLSFSGARGQQAGLPAWKVLAEESATVVVAEVVEGNLAVIDPEKKAKVEAAPGGKVCFGDPALFTVGMLSRVRIREVIKTDEYVKRGDTIGVFISGYYGSDRPTVPQNKERYVFFLRRLNANRKEFTPAVIQRIERKQQNGHLRYIEHRDKFDPSACYTPVQDGYAQVVIAPGKSQVVGEIKAAIATRP